MSNVKLKVDSTSAFILITYKCNDSSINELNSEFKT
jgi:hypothetical protein